MARTIQTIQSEIIVNVQADPVLAPQLTSTSKVAIWRLWTYIIAVAIHALEVLFDTHKSEVGTILGTQKPHTQQWYVSKAKAFQYGDALPPDTDVYATISTDDAVLIVKHAAVVEMTNILRVKLAKESGGTLAALDSDELDAATAYLNRIKDAGVRLDVTSDDPDSLQLKLTIYYDPLVLDSSGARLDGTATSPVQDAVNAYLQNMPFNGLFARNRLIDAVEATEGVVMCMIEVAQANYAALPYNLIPVEYTPDAGYMELDETFFNSNTIYIPHSPI